MATVGLDEARADMAALLDRVEQGEDVLITRRLQLVAEPVAPRSEPAERETMREALRKLAELRASLPPWSAPSTDLLRELRDERY